MKKIILFTILTLTFSFAKAQTTADEENTKKATEWVATINLADSQKAKRVTEVVTAHLTTVRNWHNEHPASTVPAGINPVTGNKLSDLDREIIADSAMPSSVHTTLMDGLKKDLTPEQVETILDKYTIGKVAFTMNGYKSIVTDLTEKEEATILAFMKQAREQAVDYKNMKQISTIFEIYKTKSEQFLNNNGRNWRTMYNDYTKKLKAEKAAKEKIN